MIHELSTDEFEAKLGALAARVTNPSIGFAGPRSLSWRVDRELVLHAAGPRALLMQFAHPKVAQGVADHSNFRKDLLGRTIRTFTAVYALIFGTLDEALVAARRIHKVHKRVRGTLPHDAGRHRAGDPYAANEPLLLAWVWSTLIDSALYAYEQFVEPLDLAQREAYYQECCSLAGLFGLGRDAFPATRVGFEAWIEELIASGEIAVGPTARELAQVFLTGQTGLKPLSPMFTLLAAGTLPPALREGFGLQWTAGTRAAYRALHGGIRVAVRIMPRPLRAMPMATRAAWRTRAV